MKKNIELSLKEAQELYGQNNAVDKMLLANFSKEELENTLPIKWSQLKDIRGFYVSMSSDISSAWCDATSINKNVFASEKEAKSALSMAQLSQLMKVYRNGWEPDWNDGDEIKFTIESWAGMIRTEAWHSNYKYLSFPTKELASQFLENFRDLIEDYFMIDKN